MDAFNFLLNLLFDLRIPPLVTIVWTNFLQFEDPAACELDITALHQIPHLSDILCSVRAVLHVNNLPLVDPSGNIYCQPTVLPCLANVKLRVEAFETIEEKLQRIANEQLNWRNYKDHVDT